MKPQKTTQEQEEISIIEQKEYEALVEQESYREAYQESLSYID